jgi:serine O-acetyltransferase
MKIQDVTPSSVLPNQSESISTTSVCFECPPVDPGFREGIARDIGAWKRIFAPTPSTNILVNSFRSASLIWNYCGLRATLLYRFGHALWKKRIPMLPGIISRANLTLHGFDVPSSVQIGPGLYVPHPVGTVIMAKRIGSNVSLISGITIGMRETPVFPTIGDNVFIGAGARVLGDITIGDNASIGANAVVLKDIPRGMTAVGIPAKIIKKRSNEAAIEEIE